MENQNIQKIYLGIKFKYFKLEDHLGSIVDYILNHKSNAFNSSVFTLVNSSFNTRELFNEITKNRIIINYENVLLEMNNVDSKHTFVDETLKKFNDVIVEGVFKDYKIKYINRIGCVFKTHLKDDLNYIKKIKDIAILNNEELNNILLSYNTNKYNLLNSEKNNNKDFEHNIYQIEFNKETNESLLACDFQKYFDPPIEDYDDIEPNFIDFCNDNLNKFEKLLNNINEKK